MPEPVHPVDARSFEAFDPPSTRRVLHGATRNGSRQPGFDPEADEIGAIAAE